jgi:hypothetical protein
MRPADRGDVAGMARVGEPVVYCRADPPADDWRLACAGMAGDQKQYAVAVRNRALQPAVDRRPGAVEVMTVQVEDLVRLESSLCELFVPAAVKCRPGAGRGSGK